MCKISCLASFRGDRCESVATDSVKTSEGWVCKSLVGTLSRSELVTLNILAVICAVLLTAVVLLSVKVCKLTANRDPTTGNVGAHCRSNTEAPIYVISDIEDCCNTMSLCEMVRSSLAQVTYNYISDAL